MSQPTAAADGAPRASPPAPSDLGIRAARGGGALLFRHGAALFLNAIGALLLGRWLGPESMGLYYAAATLLVIGRQVVAFSTPTVMVRAGRDGPWDDRSAWLQRGLAGMLVAGTLLAVALGAATAYAPARASEYALLLVAAAVGAATYAFQAVPVARLERRLEFGRIGAIEVLDPLVFNLVAIALVYAGGSIRTLAVPLVLRGAIPALVAHRTMRGHRPALPSRREIAALLREVGPLVGAQAVLWVILMAPPILIGKLAGPAEFGYAYQAAALLGSVGIPAAIFQRVAFAGLVQIESDRLRFARAVRRAVSLLASLSLPLLSAIAGFSPWWVTRACGPEWQPLERLLLVATLPVALSGLVGVVYAAMLAEGRNRLVFEQNLLHAGLYWTSMAALARPLGALAAPLAHLLAMPAAVLYLRAFARAHAPLRAYGAVAGVVGSAVLAGVTWELTASGRLMWAVLVWCVAHAAVLPIVWRRLGLRELLRRVLKGDGVAVSGV